MAKQVQKGLISAVNVLTNYLLLFPHHHHWKIVYSSIPIILWTIISCLMRKNYTVRGSVYSSSLCLISIRNTLSLFQVSVTMVFVFEFVRHHCNMTLTKSFSGIHSFIIFSCWRQKASGLYKENSSRYPYHSLVITRTFYTVNSFGSLL